MGPASFFMVLIGCAQGQQCAPIATLPVAYRSKEACLAGRSEMVAASSELGFDRVFAECREQPQPNASRESPGAGPTA